MLKYFLLGLSFSLILGCSGGSSSNLQATEDDGGSDGTATCALTDLKKIPFDVALESDHIAIATDGGVLKTIFTPAGMHAPGLTGHAGGKMDTNWMGFFAYNHAELTWLAGGDGAPCDAGETCGVPEADVLARIPHYKATIAGIKITSVKLSNRDGTIYYGTPDHWGVVGTACDGRYRLVYGHTSKVSSGLRTRMIAAGYDDPWDCNDDPACVDREFITGAPVELSIGDTIAEPQIQARTIEGHPGYLQGPTYMRDSPHAQIEFSVNDNSSYPDVPTWYSSLSAAVQTQLQNILNAEAARSSSWFYGNKPDYAWAWGAQMKLFNISSMDNTDYGSILAALGSWGEVDDVDNATCELTWDTKCNDYFVIFPIQKSTPFYNVANYASADTSYLAFKTTYNVGWGIWGEVLSPSSLNETHDQLLIKWRSDSEVPIEKYQGARFDLDTPGEMLRIRWTAEYNTQGEAATALAALADVTAVTPCAGTDDEGAVKCYKHGRGRQGTWQGI